MPRPLLTRPARPGYQPGLARVMAARRQAAPGTQLATSRPQAPSGATRAPHQPARVRRGPRPASPVPRRPAPPRPQAVGGVREPALPLSSAEPGPSSRTRARPVAAPGGRVPGRGKPPRQPRIWPLSPTSGRAAAVRPRGARPPGPASLTKASRETGPRRQRATARQPGPAARSRAGARPLSASLPPSGDGPRRPPQTTSRRAQIRPWAGLPQPLTWIRSPRPGPDPLHPGPGCQGQTAMQPASQVRAAGASAPREPAHRPWAGLPQRLTWIRSPRPGPDPLHPRPVCRGQLAMQPASPVRAARTSAPREPARTDPQSHAAVCSGRCRGWPGRAQPGRTGLDPAEPGRPAPDRARLDRGRAGPAGAGPPSQPLAWPA